MTTVEKKKRKYTAENIKKDMQRHWVIYLIALPVIAWYLIFCYAPMWGILISFVDYKPRLGFFNSQFVGLQYFKEFLVSTVFWRAFRNTLVINVYSLLFGFTAPIVLALMLNEVRAKWFKKATQTLTYLPYFISLVVACGIVRNMVSSEGLINQVIVLLGGQPLGDMLGSAKLFQPIYIISGIWQGIGWGSIIYLASLSNIDVQLYEAATIDGAGRFKQMWYVTLPGIANTIIILLILQIGGLLNHGYEKIILLYNPLTYETADVISSYVYRRGLREQAWSYSTAVGLFSNIVNFMFLFAANKVAAKYSEVSLW